VTKFQEMSLSNGRVATEGKTFRKGGFYDEIGKRHDFTWRRRIERGYPLPG